LIAADFHDEKLSFNDILAGPAGRVYAGTLYWGETMQRPGRLYLIHPTGRIQEVDDGIELANGLALSPDDRTLYFADSAARRIYSYEVNAQTGELSRRALLVQIAAEDGIPDGLTVDLHGFIWCAQWYGGQVVRYDPDGTIERRIPMPVKQVSSVAFGGKELDELYVTSAAEFWPSHLMPAAIDPKAKMGGTIYRLKTGVQGRPEHTAGLQ
jgi:D-xylonolactonase